MMKKIKRIPLYFVASLLIAPPLLADSPQPQSSSVFSFLSASFHDTMSSSSHATPQVIAFYQKMNNEPVWFAQGHLTRQGKIAIDVLKNADQEGLNPQDYADATNIIDPMEDWVDAEILLTKRFLEFIRHVQIGRIDPMKLSDDIKFHSPKKKPVELLVEALQDRASHGEKLRHMAPNLPQYAELKRILAEYRRQATSVHTWPQLSGTKALKSGDTDPEVATLRHILVMSGDLPQDLEEGTKFDAAVSVALRQFQKRYSLEPDGVVGNKTRQMLNFPIRDRIKRVIVNMERLRWLPDQLGHKHIIVNVAGYVLHGFEGEEATIMMPIIVGRPDRRTPLFYTTLKNIIFNPPWNVPYRIYLNDKLPKIRNDRGYIQRSHFTILDHKGREINPDVADWEHHGKGYHLQQSPGRHNALGRIKFNIENPYTIYLHGTPDKHLFAKKARAFSSGCIRLKHPRRLAAWVLKIDPTWSYDQIRAAVVKGETQSVELVQCVPVYFTYQTIWVKDNKKGKRIFFSDDPYHLDAKMLKMLGVA